MIRRRFVQSALGVGLGADLNPALAKGSMERPQRRENAKYRAGVIGLGWTGLLYDLGERVDDPKLEIHRTFHHHQHPGREFVATTYSEALWDRPEVELVAGAERDPKRLAIFGERYGIKALYTDAVEMLQKERLDIVAICTSTKPRAFLTVKAAELGAKGIVTEKPMCHTLEEADQMVKACADRGIPLSCGAISTTHPSFAKAKELLESGAIGELEAIETSGPGAQHQNWSYFLDSPPAWVVGAGDLPSPTSGSSEFRGEGILVTQSGLMVHFRKRAPSVRLAGSKGEIVLSGGSWRWWLEQERRRTVEMPWAPPQFLGPYGAVYTVDDVLACLEGKLDEPKNSGRRVAVALEVEIALKESSRQGGKRVDIPLADRSLGLSYASYR